jgi:hypothetical protein
MLVLQVAAAKILADKADTYIDLARLPYFVPTTSTQSCLSGIFANYYSLDNILFIYIYGYYTLNLRSGIVSWRAYN